MALMSWRTRRKTAYLSGVVGFFLLTVALPLYISTREAPTCADGKRNGDERGIDCGGSCTLVCARETRPVTVLWARPFRISEGFYSVAGYVENPNFNIVAPRVPYRFQVFDKDNILVVERRGETFISSDGAFVIFDGPFATGAREALRATLELDAPITWLQHLPTPRFTVLRQELLATTTPRIEADVRNEEPVEARGVQVSAVALDNKDNALGVSQTILDILPALGTATAVFSWPRPFDAEVARIIIVARLMPRP